jgi:hypothetical protein
MKNKRGGKRTGAGRPPATKERCACGKHTLARAIALRLKCRQADAGETLLSCGAQIEHAERNDATE